ncbi:MAG: calycin-like domain-containing protein, partial [Prevotellaceae bacterium]|nr:calycin-like domain-containing protein [Prevotellaceae bacterium]
MRKLFTTIVMAALALTASATDYKDNMRVTLDGTTIFKGATTISVDVEDASKGTYSLNLKNFVLSADVAVGNIHVTNVPSTTYSDGTVTLATEQ